MIEVLLIEPDRSLAESYKSELEKNGFSVRVCAGAQAAIMAADQLKPDVVVLELQLVEHSGIEFLYEFRSYGEWQSIPVLVQTIVPPSEFKSSWSIFKKDLGVTAYLYKPEASLKKLVQTVNKCIPVVS